MITLATTTVDISAPADHDDEWSPLSYVPLASDVRATVSSPIGDHLRTLGADSVLIDAILNCDPIDVPADDLNGCIVVDNETGQLYAIEWATSRTDALGLGHIHAGMLYRRGAAGN